MQSSHELFYEEFAVRFLIFFKEMAGFCEQFVQKQHCEQSKQPSSYPRGQKSNAIIPNNQPLSRRRKDQQDPDAPKRPLSSFILFYRDKMQEYQNKNPSLSMTENTKVIGKVWNNLAEEERNQYKERAQSLKEKYEKEYAEYAMKKGIAIPAKKKARKNSSSNNNNNKVELILDDDDEENKEVKNDDEIEIQEIRPKKDIVQVEFDDDEISSESEDEDDEQLKQDDDDDDNDDVNKIIDDDEEEDSGSDLSMKKIGNIKEKQEKKKLLTDDSDEEEFLIQKKVKQQ